MNFFQKIKAGLTRSSSKLVDGIAHALTARRLDDATLGAIEEALIAADLGPATASSLTENLRTRKFPGDIDEATVRAALADDIAARLAAVAKPFVLDAGRKPHVVLVVGVNGSGKTTTIGKLAYQLRTADRACPLLLVAGDTFRAAAVSQLKIWGERVGCPVVTGPDGSDPASLAFDALTRARAEGTHGLLIDTAGRLHNKADLMAELAKIVRVIKRVDAGAPHDVLLVLDATIGQNALAQVETFKAMVDVSGLVVTKLDGSARGGILVAIADRFALPVVAIGVGEGIDDLQSFDARDFARGLLGL